jgi:hypothetical protein
VSRYIAPAKLTPNVTELERALIAELRKLQTALEPAPADVRDRRTSRPVKAQPGEFVRVGAGETVVLPHPRPSRGQSVYLLLEGTADVISQSGTVNGVALIGVDFPGLSIAVSSGEGWHVTHSPDTIQEELDSISAVHGSLLYRNASEWTTLAPGLAGRSLITNGPATNPTYEMKARAVATKTSNTAATNATTNLTCTSYAVPANDWEVGTLFRLSGWFKYAHDVGTTPEVVAELTLDGVVIETASMRPFASFTGSGKVEAVVCCRTVGAGGTIKSDLMFQSNMGPTTDYALLGSIATTTDAIDTTGSRTLLLRVRMSAAAALNTLTVVQGYTERLN